MHFSFPTHNVIPDPIRNSARRVGGAGDHFSRARLPALDSRLRGNDEVSRPHPSPPVGKEKERPNPSSFSLGLDPRAHTMPPHRMDARIKSGQKGGGDGQGPETLILSLSKDEG